MPDRVCRRELGNDLSPYKITYFKENKSGTKGRHGQNPNGKYRALLDDNRTVVSVSI